jgi:hypothetical protein
MKMTMATTVHFMGQGRGSSFVAPGGCWEDPEGGGVAGAVMSQSGLPGGGELRY